VRTTSMGLTSNGRVSIAGTVPARTRSPATGFPPDTPAVNDRGATMNTSHLLIGDG
jgi:hypothetical protein